VPKVKVEATSKHSADETFKKIRQLLETDKDLRKMDSSYACKFDDKALSGTAKGSKFEANMKVVAKRLGIACRNRSEPTADTPRR